MPKVYYMFSDNNTILILQCLTGIHILKDDLLLSVSIDQRAILWNVNHEDLQVHIYLLEYFQLSVNLWSVVLLLINY